MPEMAMSLFDEQRAELIVGLRLHRFFPFIVVLCATLRAHRSYMQSSVFASKRMQPNGLRKL